MHFQLIYNPHALSSKLVSFHYIAIIRKSEIHKCSLLAFPSLITMNGFFLMTADGVYNRSHIQLKITQSNSRKICFIFISNFHILFSE